MEGLAKKIMENGTVKERVVHFDLLRILATFSVVMLHSSAQQWYYLDLQSWEWRIANIYDVLFRFGVPIFVMLSGALFLAREYDLNVKRLYTHNIFRLVVIYVLWSCLYGLWDCRNFDFNQAGWKDILKEMLFGRYHLWFLPMIVGIYVLLPILRVWIQNADKKNLQYFLTLFFLLQILGETIRVLCPQDEFSYILDLMKIEMACGYIGYFVLGYYIVHIGIPPKYSRFVYLSVVPACVLNIVLSNYLSLKAGEARGEIYDSFCLFTFCIVLAVFLFFIEVMGKVHYSEKVKKITREISMSTIGVYVMHVGLMEILQSHGIHTRMFPNIVGIPVFAIICFVLCLALASLLRRFPLIGKYIC